MTANDEREQASQGRQTIRLSEVYENARDYLRKAIGQEPDDATIERDVEVSLSQLKAVGVQVVNDLAPKPETCKHPAWAREGVPYNHRRCVACGGVFEENLLRVGEFDRGEPDGIRRY